MHKGFAPLLILLAVLAVSIVGGGSYFVINKVIAPLETPKKLAPSVKVNTKQSPTYDFGADENEFNIGNSRKNVAPLPAPTSKIVTYSSPKPSPTPSPMDEGPTVYTQPQGKYEIKLPSGWLVNGTNATTTYSTTKFTGPNGYIAITFGTGKDPVGGCSEKSSVDLFDRAISGCYLLQKDGSQILTRAYTKDAAGIDFTIEAYINSPLSTNRSAVLDVVKTINIE